MPLLTNIIIRVLNVIPPRLLPFVALVALALGMYGTVLVTVANQKQPKSRSWLGITSIIVAVGLELALLTIELLILRIGVSQYQNTIYSIANAVPLVALALGMYGTVLVTVANQKQPKSRSWLGITSIIVAVGLELVLLTAQLLSMR